MFIAPSVALYNQRKNKFYNCQVFFFFRKISVFLRNMQRSYDKTIVHWRVHKTLDKIAFQKLFTATVTQENDQKLNLIQNFS